MDKLADFQRLAEGLVAQAKAILVKDGFHAPILFLVSTGGGLDIVGISATGQQKMHEVVANAVRQLEAVAFVFIGEAWSASVGEIPTVSVKTLPDAHEVLVVSAVHPAWRKAWLFPFSREHGIRLGSEQVMEGDQFQGGMAEALRIR
jgi:hypothetical protein